MPPASPQFRQGVLPVTVGNGTHRRSVERDIHPDVETSVSMTPHNAVKVAQSTEIRNGFAPGAILHGDGTPYLEARVVAEKDLFDVPKTADHTERPVYGYLRDRHKPSAGPYGEAVFDVSPQGPVTTTYGDSLDNYQDAKDSILREYEEEHTAPDPRDLPHEIAERVDVEDFGPQHVPETGWRTGYREVQMHGGPISTEHVTKAHFFGQQWYREAQATRDAGIRTSLYERGEFQPTLDRDTFGTGKSGWVDVEAFGGKFKAPTRDSLE
jgi:hypothetical protein